MRTPSMRGRDSRDEATPLPPPPAPPARDANPWPMPATHREPAAGGKASARPSRSRVQAEPADEVDATTPASGIAVALGLAFMVLVGALIRFRESGDMADLAGVIFIIGMLVLFAISRARSAVRSASRKKNRGRSNTD